MKTLLQAIFVIGLFIGLTAMGGYIFILIGIWWFFTSIGWIIIQYHKYKRIGPDLEKNDAKKVIMEQEKEWILEKVKKTFITRSFVRFYYYSVEIM